MDENAHKIKLGSVVRLKSGGPDMTVTFIDDDGIALCRWMELNVDQVWAEFVFDDVPPEALDLIQDMPEAG